MPHVIQSLFHLLLQICRRATHRDQIRLAQLGSVRTPIESDPPESRSTKKARIPWKWKEAGLIRSGKVRGDELSTVNIQKVRKRGNRISGFSATEESPEIGIGFLRKNLVPRSITRDIYFSSLMYCPFILTNLSISFIIWGSNSKIPRPDYNV
jgi:hypothetical protein